MTRSRQPSCSAILLAQRATYVVPLYAGPEQTVATKSYTTSLLALALLAGRLAGVPSGALAEGLSATIDAVAQVCAGSSESITHLSPVWRDAGPITPLERKTIAPSTCRLSSDGSGRSGSSD